MSFLFLPHNDAPSTGGGGARSLLQGSSAPSPKVSCLMSTQAAPSTSVLNLRTWSRLRPQAWAVFKLPVRPRHQHTQRQTCCSLRLDNRELLVGDVLSLTCFCLYKQVRTLVTTSSGNQELTRLPNADHSAHFDA